MGRRELLIILGFIVVGAVLYQVTAPPVTEERGFSLRRMIDGIRTDLRRDSANAHDTESAVIDLPATVSELRISGVTGRMVVTGEDRADVAYELDVRSTGPDEATATEYAKRTAIVTDDLGETIGLRVSYPDEAQQHTEIRLKVPRRLTVRAEGGNSSEFSNLHAVRLEGVIGETTIDGVSGEVAGSHRTGRLTVSGAGSVNVTLVSSRAEFSKITGGLKISTTRGSTRVTNSSGPLDVEHSNNELLVDGQRGPITVSGAGGRIEISDPQGEVRVDVRRAEINLALSRAVPATVITTDEQLTLTLDGPPAVVVDAIVTGRARIVASDFDLTPETGQDQSELRHAFGDAATVRVSLRNRREDIVIRKR